MDIQINKNVVVVFDLDDTLYNELDYLKSAFIDLSKQLDKTNYKKTYAIIISLYRNKEDAFAYLSNTFNVDKAILIDKYRLHTPKIKPKKGVKKLFKKIKKKQGKIGIITDGRSATQRNKIKALKLEKYIDYLIISDEIGAEKPNEKAFKTIEKESEKDKFYYIGDNFKKDFIAPNNLNWTTIALIDKGINIHTNFYKNYSKQQLPNHFILNLKEINPLS